MCKSSTDHEKMQRRLCTNPTPQSKSPQHISNTFCISQTHNLYISLLIHCLLIECHAPNGPYWCLLQDSIKYVCRSSPFWGESAVLDDLIPILQPDYCKKITCEFCDITDSTTITNSNIVEQSFGESDIFLTSYLMTETRNQWDEFIIKMVGLAKVGALFYFAEPVPWQLHRLIRMSAPPDLNCDDTMSPLHRLRFVWIDCSMHYPDMQTLDGRSGGPAVLLAMKI